MTQEIQLAQQIPVKNEEFLRTVQNWILYSLEVGILVIIGALFSEKVKQNFLKILNFKNWTLS